MAANPGSVRSDIWRHVPQPIKIVFDLVMRLLFLNVQQGSATSVMGAIMPTANLEAYYRKHSSAVFTRKLSYHAKIPYLVPYNIFFNFSAVANELIGPYACPHFSVSSNVPNIEDISHALWEYSNELCLSKVKEAWKDTPEKLEDFEKIMKD